MIQILLRDLRFNMGRAGLPVAFFLLVATLVPFAVGPDAAMLARIGPGIAWVAALLAALLPVERLIAPDAAAGVLDQYAVRGVSEEAVAVAKLAAHWLGFGPALMLVSVPAAALLGLDGAALARLEIGLLIGTPGLAALGLIAAALTLETRAAAALSGLLVLPLAVPLLIFGAGGELRLLGAVSLLLVAIAPFVCGGAVRASRR